MANNDFKFKYEKYSGKFIDYRGAERDYTMVAVSIPVKPTDSLHVSQTVTDTIDCVVPAKNVLDEETGTITYVPEKTVKKDIVDEALICDVAKVLSVGVSVRCNRDANIDENLSLKIAYGKAVNRCNHAMYVTHAGMVNTKMVQAFIEQEAEHFEKDPGSYLDTYNADKLAFLKNGKIAPVEMTDAEFAAHEKDVAEKEEAMHKHKHKSIDLKVKAKAIKEELRKGANI